MRSRPAGLQICDLKASSNCVFPYSAARFYRALTDSA